MADQWYLSRDGQSFGPYTWNEIVSFSQSGNLQPQDQLWNPATDQWTQADQVPGLFSTPPASPSTQTPMASSPSYNAPKPSTGTSKTPLFMIAGILFLALIVTSVALLWPRGASIPFLSGDGSVRHEAFQRPAPKMNTWEYQPLIAEPIVMEAGEQDITLGNLQTHGISVEIPQQAFDQKTTVSLYHPSENPQINTNAIKPVGAPVRFEIQGQQHRTNEPVVVRVKVDPAELSALEETGGFRGVHYNEEGEWTYVHADNVNVQEGYIQFHTYHNFLWGAAELTEEERMEQFIKDRSVQTWGEKQMGDEVENVTREMIHEIMRREFNASNTSELNLIADEVLKEMKYGTLEYGKVALDLKNGDYASLTSNVATILGNTLALSMKRGTLKTVFGEAGNAASLAGHLWEGDYRGAGLKLADIVSTKFVPFYKVAKVWIQVVDARITNWKNDEIEKAYKIYRDGVESMTRWGYNVEPGDFDSLWDQMRGVARQVGIDAVDRYCKAHDIQPSSLSRSERERIMNEARENLRKQFEQRVRQEEEIKAIEEDQRELIRQFESWGLLRRGSAWFPFDEPIERMLERLYGQVERIMKDTGRFELIYRRMDLHDEDRGQKYYGELKNTELLAKHVADLISIRYNYGEERYFQKLIEYGYLSPIMLEEGIYQGYLVITDTPIVKALREMAKNPPSREEIQRREGDAPDSCEGMLDFDLSDLDFSEVIPQIIPAIEGMKGQEVPLYITIRQGISEDQFTATIMADFESTFPDYECENFSENTEFSVELNNNKIIMRAISLSDEAGGWVFEGTISPTGEIRGTFRMTSDDPEYQKLAGTSNFFTGDWQVNRSS